MAEFEEVLRIANDGYHERDDYPPYAFDPMTDRNRWSAYLRKINAELDQLSLARRSAIPREDFYDAENK